MMLELPIRFFLKWLTLPKNVDKNTFLPFHSGAVRYYHEIGINIPAALMPTN
jgi:hypothetical protein